jgi:hypothetical protein
VEGSEQRRNFEFARIYLRLRAEHERMFNVHLWDGIEESKIWKSVIKGREIADSLRADYEIYIKCQRKVAQLLGKKFYPNFLHGKGAIQRFKWYTGQFKGSKVASHFKPVKQRTPVEKDPEVELVPSEDLGKLGTLW